MVTVISLDLAACSYAGNGLAVLRASPTSISCELIPLATSLSGVPAVGCLGVFLDELASEVGAGVILVDGPQAWKSPNTSLLHQRLCEKALHTPGKTGEPGRVKPRTWSRFARFSIALFDALHEAGWPRLARGDADAVDGRLALESFPTAAWRALRLPPLPSKQRCGAAGVRRQLERLSRTLPLHVSAQPTHDELQAVVAGIAGIAVAARRGDLFAAVGAPPYRLDGVWREGFIVCPCLPGGAGGGAA